MALVNVLNIAVVGPNPTVLSAPFSFEVTFSCVGAIDDDLEWRVIYVGSAQGVDYDQELESVLVGPVPVGTNKFVLNVRERGREVEPRVQQTTGSFGPVSALPASTPTALCFPCRLADESARHEPHPGRGPAGSHGCARDVLLQEPGVH